jgi:hypothetical protein
MSDWRGAANLARIWGAYEAVVRVRFTYRRMEYAYDVPEVAVTPRVGLDLRGLT